MLQQLKSLALVSGFFELLLASLARRCARCQGLKQEESAFSGATDRNFYDSHRRK